MLIHLGRTRRLEAEAEPDNRTSKTEYFNRDMGIAYRFTRWNGDDALISYSFEHRFEGYGYLKWTLVNFFPHIIFPNKDALIVDGGGNYYARQMGMLNPLDTTTGISFGAPAEAAHLGGWIAICLVLPLIWLPFLISIEFVCGDLRRAPWGMFFAVLFSHMAPETGAAGILAFIWFYNLTLFLCMVLATSLAPIIGSAFSTRLRDARMIGAPHWRGEPTEMAAP